MLHINLSYRKTEAVWPLKLQTGKKIRTKGSRHCTVSILHLYRRGLELSLNLLPSPLRRLSLLQGEIDDRLHPVYLLQSVLHLHICLAPLRVERFHLECRCGHLHLS